MNTIAMRLAGVKTGESLFYSFPYFLYRRNPNGKLKSLPPGSLNSEYKPPVPFHERRKPDAIFTGTERRKKAVPNRLVYEVLPEVCANPIDSLNRVERNRLLYQVFCESCGVDFPNEFENHAHLPCHANSKLARLGLFDLFRRWRETRHGVLRCEEMVEVLEILDGMTAEEVFHRACKRGDFSYAKGYAAFRAEMWLQFLARFLDGIDGKNPRAEHRQQAARIDREYVRSDAERREQIVGQLFDAQCSLQKIAKRDEPGRPHDLPQTQFSPQAVREILENFEGKKAVAELQKMGVPMSEGSKDRYVFLKKLRHTYDASSKKRAKRPVNAPARLTTPASSPPVPSDSRE